MLTGDFLFGRAAKLAAETDCLPLMKLFAETLGTIVNGELTQMFAAKGLIDRRNYNNRIYAKTASLFELTATAAALLALAPAALAEDGAPTIEEIIVTAQKREQSLQDVPISLQVVDSDLINDTGATDMGDLSQVMPVLHGEGFVLSWMDPVAWLAVGSAYALVFWSGLKQKPLVPVGDPRLEQCLAFHNV